MIIVSFLIGGVFTTCLNLLELLERPNLLLSYFLHNARFSLVRVRKKQNSYNGLNKEADGFEVRDGDADGV